MDLKKQVRESLLNAPLESFMNERIFEGVPYVFGGDRQKYWTWRAALANAIGVDPKNVVVSGSAAVGVSLNPYKSFREYGPHSDIDVAVVDHYHFDLAWNELRSLGTRRFDLSDVQRRSVDDHRAKYIYWATIATDKLLPLFPFAGRWQAAIDQAARAEPTVGREIKIRLYRDYAAMTAYLAQGLASLRNELLNPGDGR